MTAYVELATEQKWLRLGPCWSSCPPTQLELWVCIGLTWSLRESRTRKPVPISVDTAEEVLEGKVDIAPCFVYL